VDKVQAELEHAAVRMRIESEREWVGELIAEGAAGELDPPDGVRPASLLVRIESARQPFATDGWRVITRGVWQRGDETVMEDVCATGFDLHLRVADAIATFTYRWRPSAATRIVNRGLRSRFHLLARAALVQYPALWWTGTAGRVPLHASGIASATSTTVVSAAGGVGRSTLLLREQAAGARITGDNLAVTDGRGVWGLVEPVRVAGGTGRRMPHGRSEMPVERRVRSLEPASVVILERGAGGQARLVPCARESAVRALATSTYMAGELRRYWPFAASLAASTGHGPGHPPIAEVASSLVAGRPCWSLLLGRIGDASLEDLLSREEAVA
jgi:hypothetical protein